MIKNENAYYTEIVNEKLIDELIEGFQIIGFDWRYLYVNKSLVKHSKFNDKQRLIGNTMQEMYPGIEQTEMFKRLKICMEERHSQSMLNQFTYPDNSRGWFDLRMEPVSKGVLIISVDVTNRQNELEEKAKRLLGLEQILHITSHEVRKPLANIMGAFELLRQPNIRQDELLIIAKYLSISVNSLEDCLRQLTDFATKHKSELNEE